MIAPAKPVSSSVGRMTGLVLGLVVFLCLSMIGLTGYLKYQLDRSQSVLAAPDAAASDQDIGDKLRRALGYSGLTSLLQNYATTHDAALLPDMKAQIKIVNDLISHSPEKTPTGMRRDLQAIAQIFESTVERALKSSADPSQSFSASDMVPIYATLPVLDSRIAATAAVNRLSAQSELQFWSMLLTLVCWCSLIIASALAVGIYLSLCDRNSAPLRGLAQSIKNMAHGDLTTPIWGMERSDMVGELARTVDMARYHFNQLPDMSLLSDKGPVRIRFEGGTKSMFEAMMQLITRDSEQVRQQATTLTEAVMKQQQVISQMSAQVETVLHNVLQRGQTGDAQVRQVVNDLVGSANALKHAQEHAADQLNRIVPFMQDRAQGISEIAQITGKQVSTVLQSLILTERGLKNSAAQSEVAITKLSSTADDLGSRLFGAINLLQASGKVLAETTETTQSRLNEAIEKLHQSIAQPIFATTDNETNDTLTSDTHLKLDELVGILESTQKRLEVIVAEQSEAARAQIELLNSHSSSLLAQSTTTVQTLSSAADRIREQQTENDQTLRSISKKLDDIGTRISQQAALPTTPEAPQISEDLQQTNARLSDIATQIADMAQSLSSLQAQMTKPVDVAPPTDGENDNKLMLEIKTGFETTVRSLAQMREQLTNMVINTQAQMPIVTPTLPRDVQEQMEQQTQILTELVATLGVLDAHMQQIKTDMAATQH